MIKVLGYASGGVALVSAWMFFQARSAMNSYDEQRQAQALKNSANPTLDPNGPDVALQQNLNVFYADQVSNTERYGACTLAAAALAVWAFRST